MTSYFLTSGSKRNEVLKNKKESANEVTITRERMNEELKMLKLKKMRIEKEKLE